MLLGDCWDVSRVSLGACKGPLEGLGRLLGGSWRALGPSKWTLDGLGRRLESSGAALVRLMGALEF